MFNTIGLLFFVLLLGVLVKHWSALVLLDTALTKTSIFFSLILVFFFSGILLVALGYIDYLLLKIPYTIIDLVHLMVHEAGHIIWSFGGEFMTALGGSLNTWVFFAILGLIFAWKKLYRLSIFCFFVLGLGLIDDSSYIQDSRARKLVLLSISVGEGKHDWEKILGDLDLMGNDIIIGEWFKIIGIVICAVSLLAYLLLSLRDRSL